MIQSSYKVLGVMSGTSLDGIDLAEIDFQLDANHRWTYQLGNTSTLPYSDSWKKKLREAIGYSEEALDQLNEDCTALLGGRILEFIEEKQITSLDAVCSHGHTIRHLPEQGITLQIGNLPVIAAITGQKVVCDFRVQDVELGGQGAPLVPIGDELLFGDYDYCLNLGGFANCSTEQEIQNNVLRIAYDICPVNIVLNEYARKLGREYDEGGALASAGIVNPHLLEQLNELGFYQQALPKSLGLEWVQQFVTPLIEKFEDHPQKVLATFTEHAAVQIANQFEADTKVLVTGGGAYNEFLISRIRALSGADLIIPDAKLLEFKEALVFGLLGVLRLRNEVNCLASVTGASRNHSSGSVFLP